MDPDVIVPIILKKGLKNVNLAMFSESEKRIILEKVAEIYLRLNKKDELLQILELTDMKKYNELLREMAESYFSMCEYEKAAFVYEKIGDAQMAATIKGNFLKKDQ